MLTEGAILDGRYEIVGLLATGAMGEVYRARRSMLGDEVAIKIVRRGEDAGGVLRERFMRESRTCAQLRHPHIVSVLDFNIDPAGQPFLVMEYLNGPSLRDEIAASGPMDFGRVVATMRPISAALQAAHDRGILHRDVKPGNIVSHRFDSGDIVYKVVDFGLTNLRDPDETRLTAGHEFLGTIAYASPEQVRGEPLNAQSDVFSLAAVVFEMLTGRLPYEGQTLMEMLERRLAGDPPLVSTLRAGLPEWVDAAVARGLAGARGQRWPSVAAFGEALIGPDDVLATASAPASGLTGLLAKYELGPLLGHGRLGSEVYAGTHRALGVRVAIRTLRRTAQTAWDAARARFIKESLALQVAHPSILQVRDYGEEGDIIYVVTDLIEGPSLRQVMVSAGALPAERLKPLVLDLAEAAAAVHGGGGLLCGLTPEIIRVTSDAGRERLRISSGGVCQIQDLLATVSEQTLRGGGLVDPEWFYMAPELLAGQRPDVRSDVYTIGVLAYEMATGALPFTANTLPELMGRVMSGQPQDPRTLAPSFPEALAAVVLRSLQRDPADRFPDAQQFATAWVGPLT